MGGVFAGKRQTVHPPVLKQFPYYKIKKTGAKFASSMTLTGNKFYYFNEKTRYGKKQSIMEQMYTPDYIPLNSLFNSHMIDVEIGALAIFSNPSPGWAVLDDCGDFTCTGLKNSLWMFVNTTWEGKVPILAERDFSAIADTEGFSQYVDNCLRQPIMNGYYCRNPNMGILLIDSQDPDREDRSMQPIYYKQEGTKIKNKLNAFMDHAWDGFYTSQKRIQMFPGLVDATPGNVYEVEFTGSPAKNMKFALRSANPEARMTVKIYYPSAQSRQIFKNGKYIPFNQWDKSINQYGAISEKQECGENRYIGVKNILEFAISGGCELEIRPRNAIQSMVRMEWTMEEFYATGGTTTFLDRLAGSLGIHASTIKIVSVYQGSLVINYEITTPDDDQSTLNAIQADMEDKFATNKIDLGAPILDVKAGENSIVKDGIVSKEGYTPIVITKT